jgi:hypothetical protein
MWDATPYTGGVPPSQPGSKDEAVCLHRQSRYVFAAPMDSDRAPVIFVAFQRMWMVVPMLIPGCA